MKLVRLYPYWRPLGWVMRNYTHVGSTRSIRFLGDRGWYQVDDDMAAELAKVPQRSNVPDGPKAFVIVSTQQEAEETDERIRDSMNRGKKVDDSVGTAAAPIAVAKPRPGTAPKAAPDADHPVEEAEPAPAKAAKSAEDRKATIKRTRRKRTF